MRIIVAPAILAALSLAGPLPAAEGEGATAPAVERIPVPPEDTARWPEGEWVPIQRQKLDRLLQSLKPKEPAPRRAWIGRADYSATFASGKLRAGRWQADVFSATRRPMPANADAEADASGASGGVLLPLKPLNLAVSELAWTNGKALWGTTSEGHTALFVEQASRRLQGRWSLPGRSLPDRVEFDLQVPRAATSEIRLRVPEGRRVRSSAGQVSRSESGKDPGWVTWQIDLGSLTGCRVTVFDPPQTPERSPFVLVERDLSYVAGEEGLQWQAEFRLDVVQGAVNRFLFAVPAGIEVFSVTYGGEDTVSWRSVSAGTGQFVAVRFPELLAGRSRPIRLVGIGSAKLQQPWVLPQPRLVAADRFAESGRDRGDAIAGLAGLQGLNNTAFLTGDVRLKVQPPLEVGAVEADGFLQTATIPGADGGDTFTYRQYLPASRFSIEIGYPDLELAAVVFTHIDATTEDWRSTSEIVSTARTGNAFRTRYHIAPWWEITNVRGGPSETADVDWHVVRRPAGRRELIVEFRDAVRPGRPKRVEVAAKRVPVGGARPSRLPILQPLDHTSAEFLVAISHPPTSAPMLRSSSTFERIEAGRMPAIAQESPLWKQLEQRGRQHPPLLLYSNTADAAGVLTLERSQLPVRARAWNKLVLEGSRLSEQFVLQFEPDGRGLDRVYVYLTAAGRAPSFRLAGDQGRPLSAARLPTDRHAEWQLPSGGELWEIRLPRPYRSSFQILAGRTRTAETSLRPALAFVRVTGSFGGFVQFLSPADVSVTFNARHLTSTTPQAVVHDGFQPAAPIDASSPLWQYGTDTDSQLTAEVHRPDAGSPTRRLATLSLRSVIAAEQSGTDVHRAVFRLQEEIDQGSFRFRLPETASLISVERNGKPLRPARRGDRFEVSPLAPGRINTIAVRYRTSAPSGMIRSIHRAPLPRTNYRILQFDWQFALPPDLRLGGEPESVVLRSPSHRPSWSQRMFGPLGRSAGSPLFNPLSVDSWRNAFASPASRRRQPAGTSAARHQPEADASGSPEDAFAPSGWRVYRAASPVLPENPELETWDDSRIHLLGWAGLLVCLTTGIALRLLQVRARARVTPLWLAACLMAAWTVPDAYAEIVGGCLAGSLIAVLIPRRFLERLKLPVWREPRSVSVGSTLTAGTGAALVLALSMLAAAQQPADRSPAIPQSRAARGDAAHQHPGVSRSRGAREPAEQSPPAAPDTVRILVPQRGDAALEDGTSPVYIDRKRLRRLRETARRESDRSDYLISSADYRAKADEGGSVTVEAAYQVNVLPTADVARVTFPDAAVNPAGCRVNGEPQPIVLAPDGRRFVIELPRSPKARRQNRAETFDVRLTFHPAARPMPGGAGYRLWIPPVASARFQQDFAEPFAAASIRSLTGTLAVSTGEEINARLPATAEIEVRWSKDPEDLRPSPRLAADVAGVVTVRPAWLEYRYHVDYRLLEGTADSIGWQLPRTGMTGHAATAESSPGGGGRLLDGLFVQEVKVNGRPADFSVSPSAGGDHLTVVFDKPQTDDFTVDASFLAPLARAGSEIRIPVTPLVPGPSASAEARVASDLLGVRTPSEFELSLGDDGPLNEIAVDTFPAGDVESILPTPRFAFEVTEPAELPFTVLPRKPVRQARVTQTVVVRRSQLDWSMTAEVETSRAPAFLHRLLVDPQLRITSLSVADEAERLARPSRRGRRLDLFLSDKATGAQTIRAEGTVPLRLGVPRPLPLARLAETDVSSSRLAVEHEPELAVQLLDDDGVALLEGNAEQRRPEEEDLQFLGEFRVLPDRRPPRITARRRTSRLHTETVTRVNQIGARRLQVASTVRVASDDGPLAPFRIHVPAEPGSRLDVRSTDAEYELQPQTAGGTTLQVRARSADKSALVVRIAATLGPENKETAPSTDGAARFVVRSPEVPDAAGVAHYVVLPADAPIDREALLAGKHWHTVDADALPAWYVEAAENGTPAPQQQSVLQTGASTWSLRWTAREARPESRVVLADTRILLRRAEEIGSTVLLTVNEQHADVELAWPPHTRLRALFVDDKQVTPPPPKEGTLTVPIPKAEDAHLVVIHWRRPVSSARPLAAARQPGIPYVKNLPTIRSLFALVPPAGKTVIGRRGLTRLDTAAHQLQRLQALLSVDRSRDVSFRNAPDDPSPVHRALAKLVRQLTDRPEVLEGLTADQRQQLQRLQSSLQGLPSRNDRPKGDSREADASGSPTASNRLYAAYEAEPSALEAGSREVLLGRLADNDGEATISFWLVERRVSAALFALAVLLLLPVLFHLLRIETGQWLYHHQPVAWILLGLVWWLCLRPGALGIALLLAGGLLAGWELVARFRTARQSVSEVRGPQSESAVKSGFAVHNSPGADPF